MQLSDRQIAEFFRRSYTAMDGLWFVKLEERYGFDAALDIDDEVWKVFPKIQARTLKGMLNLTGGGEAFLECFAAKLGVEGFAFQVEQRSPGSLRVSISRCPWHDAMVKSGRAALSAKIGSRICDTEYSTWAAEFDERLRYSSRSRICEGAGLCVLDFSR